MLDPILEGVWAYPIPGGRELGAILHTPSNFWTTDGKELKFDMEIEIHELSSKLEERLMWNV